MARFSGLRIGAVSKRTGTSASAIRFYEEEGLLEPAARTPSGYRLYDDDNVARLQFINRAKTLGLRLTDIRDILRSPDAASERQLLSHRIVHKLAEVHDQRDELTRLEEALRGLYVRLQREDCDCRHFAECDCGTVAPTPEEVTKLSNETLRLAQSPCSCGCGGGRAMASVDRAPQG